MGLPEVFVCVIVIKHEKIKKTVCFDLFVYLVKPYILTLDVINYLLKFLTYYLIYYHVARYFHDVAKDFELKHLCIKKNI